MRNNNWGWREYAMLVGGPLAGSILGYALGRKASTAFMGGLVGGSLGLVGCYRSGLDIEGGVDAGTGTNAPLCSSGVRGVPAISGIGTGDFEITFRIVTTAQEDSTLLYQRAVCDNSKDSWDVWMKADGTIAIKLVQAPNNTAELTSESPVNDGQPHDVVIKRRAGSLTIFVDGVSSKSVLANQSLGALPPLGLISGNPCESFGRKALVGSLSNVCVN